MVSYVQIVDQNHVTNNNKVPSILRLLLLEIKKDSSNKKARALLQLHLSSHAKLPAKHNLDSNIIAILPVLAE